MILVLRFIRFFMNNGYLWLMWNILWILVLLLVMSFVSIKLVLVWMFEYYIGVFDSCGRFCIMVWCLLVWVFVLSWIIFLMKWNCVLNMFFVIIDVLLVIDVKVIVIGCRFVGNLGNGKVVMLIVFGCLYWVIWKLVLVWVMVVFVLCNLCSISCRCVGFMFVIDILLWVIVVVMFYVVVMIWFLIIWCLVGCSCGILVMVIVGEFVFLICVFIWFNIVYKLMMLGFWVVLWIVVIFLVIMVVIKMFLVVFIEGNFNWIFVLCNVFVWVIM